MGEFVRKMVDKNTSFHGLAKFNEEGNLACLCSYEIFEEGKCACALEEDDLVSEVWVDITVLPNSATQNLKKEVNKFTKEVKKAFSQDVNKVSREIKRGVAELEKAIKGSRFRF